MLLLIVLVPVAVLFMFRSIVKNATSTVRSVTEIVDTVHEAAERRGRRKRRKGQWAAKWAAIVDPFEPTL